ncbi:hypothetical protein BLA29_014693, partial [Euroglyphus maynei]
MTRNIDIEIDIMRKKQSEMDAASELGREPSAREPSGLGAGVSAPGMETSEMGREPSSREPSGLGAGVSAPEMETSGMGREPSAREP